MSNSRYDEVIASVDAAIGHADDAKFSLERFIVHATDASRGLEAMAAQAAKERGKAAKDREKVVGLSRARSDLRRRVVRLGGKVLATPKKVAKRTLQSLPFKGKALAKDKKPRNFAGMAEPDPGTL